MITIPIAKGTNMSILEIILYSVIGSFTVIYVAISIYKIKKGKKNPKKEEEENEE